MDWWYWLAQNWVSIMFFGVFACGLLLGVILTAPQPEGMSELQRRQVHGDHDSHDSDAA